MADRLLESELTLDQRDHALALHTALEGLLGALNDVLDLTRIAEGALHLEAVPFDVRVVVDEVMESLAGPALERGVEIGGLVGHDVPAALAGDPGRLRQVLAGLVEDVVARAERGDVAVRVSVESEDSRSATLRFEICAGASGLTSATRGRPGLPLARRIVEMMGGAFAPGGGAEAMEPAGFTARFEKRPAEALALPSPRRDLSGIRALVVDDNDMNRRTLGEQLRSWGMVVEEAPGGVEALRAVREAAAAGRRPEVALLDMLMPDMGGLDLGRALKADPGTAPTRLVLLTPWGFRGQAAASREAGFSAVLAKPVRQSHLRECLATVLGHPAAAAAGGASEPVRLVTRHALREARPRPRLLVAEDHKVSQLVAVRMLERLGCGADVAANGREAVEAASRRRYDLILMDCRMPVMDGFQAARAIRDLERGTGRRTPIVALTASTPDESGGSCLEAGMDAFLTKPISREGLSRTLARWLAEDAAGGGEVRQQAGSGPSARDARPAVVASVLADFAGAGGDRGAAFLDSRIDGFLAEVPRRLDALRAAVVAGRMEEIETIAHTLKGVCGTMGATGMSDICAELVREVRARETAGMEEELARLHRELERAGAALEAHRASAA
jgi:CheY-like chemotaxis protein/HPt (histidine-containing phosphotransfer) domain-containing protein